MHAQRYTTGDNANTEDKRERWHVPSTAHVRCEIVHLVDRVIDRDPDSLYRRVAPHKCERRG